MANIQKTTLNENNGKQYLESKKPKGFKEATHFMGALDRMLTSVLGKENQIVNGLSKREKTNVKAKMDSLKKSTDIIVALIKK